MKISLQLLSSLIAIALLINPGTGSAEDAPKKKTKHLSAITIGPDTTRVTEPVDELGYVDYLAALNQQFGRGVTPQNNAAVLMWRVIGTREPNDLQPEQRAKYFRMLGIKESDGKGPLVSIEDFVGHKLKTREASELDTKMYDDQEVAQLRPWISKDYPQLAELLTKNHLALDLTIQATKRPCYYLPMVKGKPNGTMLSVLLPDLSEYRSLARMLTMRAMRSTGAGKVDAAWNDLLACWRLGALIGRGPSLVEGLVGLAIEGIAAKSTVQFLHEAKLSDKQLGSIRADLAKLPPQLKMVDRLHVKHYIILDIFQIIEREGPEMLAQLDLVVFVEVSDSTTTKGVGFEKVLKRVLLRAVIDWNFVMKSSNMWFDRIVAIGNEVDRRKRVEADNALASGMIVERQRLIDPKWYLTAVLSGKTPRRIISERFVGLWIQLLLPAITSVYEKEFQGDLLVDLVDTTIALRLYHNKHGKYPKKLADLVPAYRKAVPIDIYAKCKPVRYKKAGDGFVLYSIGLDEKDNGGPADEMEDDDDSDSDDLGFRVPAK